MLCSSTKCNWMKAIKLFMRHEDLNGKNFNHNLSRNFMTLNCSLSGKRELGELVDAIKIFDRVSRKCTHKSCFFPFHSFQCLRIINQTVMKFNSDNTTYVKWSAIAYTSVWEWICEKIKYINFTLRDIKAECCGIFLSFLFFFSFCDFMRIHHALPINISTIYFWISQLIHIVRYLRHKIRHKITILLIIRGKIALKNIKMIDDIYQLEINGVGGERGSNQPQNTCHIFSKFLGKKCFFFFLNDMCSERRAWINLSVLWLY